MLKKFSDIPPKGRPKLQSLEICVICREINNPLSILNTVVKLKVQRILPSLCLGAKQLCNKNSRVVNISLSSSKLVDCKFHGEKKLRKKIKKNKSKIKLIPKQYKIVNICRLVCTICCYCYCVDFIILSRLIDCKYKLIKVSPLITLLKDNLTLMKKMCCWSNVISLVFQI